jgi:uncharacterized membrane protein YkoI
MKNVIIIIALAIMTIALAMAQKVSSDKVPAIVTSAFKAKFSTATDAKWEIEKKTEYEAEFKLNGAEYSANFKEDGTWLETEMEISVSQLPETVSGLIAKDFAGFKVEEAEKTETSDNKLFYEVEVSKDKEKYEVKISPTGEILNKKIKKQDND